MSVGLLWSTALVGSGPSGLESGVIRIERPATIRRRAEKRRARHKQCRGKFQHA